MNLIKKIKILLKEAEIFHSQGLLDEAMVKYNEATELIKNDEQLKSKKKLIHGISEKINAIKKDLTKIHEAPKKPDVSTNVQNLIKKMFLFSAKRDEDTIALDGAIALAKFGQYNKALKEFNELLKKDSLRVVAAKNILRCHMALASAEDAIAQYEQWHAGDIFNKSQLDKLSVFFENILAKEGIDKTLQQPEVTVDDLGLLIKESLIDEPVIDESVIPEPVIDEPVIDESLTLESVIDESVIPEPVIDEPVIQEPVIEESLTLESVIDESVIDEPVIDESVIPEPVIDEPVIQEPVIEESLTLESVIDESVIDESVIDEPVIDESVIDESVIPEPVIDEPVIEESLTLESVIDEPVIDESVIPEPVIDKPVIHEPVIEVEESQEAEVIDINGIGITIDSGSQRGEIVELDVSFQSRNVISLLISQRNKYLIEDLEIGDTLNDIQFYSPIAMFTGSCVVSAISEIKSGPRQGDYSLDLKVQSG
jgi:hypothetical protein